MATENGDRLTREEFERRYDAMPDLKKAELINGIVYVGSPVRFRAHAEPHAYLVGWLGVYCAATPEVGLADSTTVRLGLDTDPQPDALLRIEPQAGGRSHISADAYVEGAPELIVEIAASTASHDLHDKLDVYRQSGVQEYLVWRVYDEQIDWFALQDGEYIRLTPDESGVIHSQVFPGLRLALSALLAGEIAQVLAELQKGLGTAEHADFVERLGESEQAAN
jgi:Uma2 family endonuclease